MPAFVIEKQADGQFTVFVSSSPTPMAGLYISATRTRASGGCALRKAIMCVTKWGAGAAEMRAAIHPASREKGAK